MILRTLSLAAISLTLAACNISGTAEKGPFKAGSSVSSSQLDSQASPISSTTINTQISNNQGYFSIDRINWNGWTEIIVSGEYFNELDNADSETSLTLNAITRKDRRFDSANVNIFTHLAAARIRQHVANGQNRNKAWRDTHTEIIETFGLSRVKRNFNRGVDKLSLTRGSGHYRKDNANLLLFTGSFLSTGGDATSLQALTDDFADDAQFNGVGETAFKAIATVGNTPDLLNTLSQNLSANGANNPPNNDDLGELPLWVNTDDVNEDVTPPVISINGDNPVQVEVGNTYNDLGATAEDDIDGEVTVNSSNDINTSVLGSYTVTYTATDAAGNEASETRQVNIVDLTAPVIELIGSNPQIIEANSDSVYQDLGSTVTDNYDVDISATVDTSVVDISTPGNYTLTYNASDSSGNTATAVERIVTVIPAPYQIVFVTDTPDSSGIFLAPRNINTALFTQGVEFITSVVDANGTPVDGEPSFDISVVDLSTPGTYPMILSFTDEYNRTITRVLTVIVSNSAPTAQNQNITIDEDSNDNTITLMATDPDPSDTLVYSITNQPTNGTLTGTTPNVRYTPNPNYAGTDSFTFSASDGLETSTATVTITITDLPEPDTTAPVINLIGNNPDTVNVSSDTSVSYNDAGATASDDVDGDISSNIAVSGSVNLNLVGTYTLNYDVRDNAGNLAETKTRTVNVVPNTSTVSVRIIEADGSPLDDVKVTFFQNGAPVLSLNEDESNLPSNAEGIFNASLNENSEYTLQFNKVGYATQVIPVKSPSANNTIDFDVMMIARGQVQSFNGSFGGMITGEDGANVILSPNSFVDPEGNVVTGNIFVTVTPVDISTASGVAAFPGEYAGTAEGDTSPSAILSYGTVEYKFTDEFGTDLQLADGETADILIPMYDKATQEGGEYVVGDTIALWSLNESTGLWLQEGTGTVVASPSSPTGLALQARVSHFTWWNCDVSMNAARAIITVLGDQAGSAMIQANTTANVGAWRPNSVNTVINIGETTAPLAVPSNGQTCFWAILSFLDGSNATTQQQCYSPAPNETFNLTLGTITDPLAIAANPASTITGYINTPVDIINIQPLSIETSVVYSLSSGSLPNGVTLATVTGTKSVLSGTATEAGTFTATISAVDSEGNTDAIEVDYTIIDAVAPPELPSFADVSITNLPTDASGRVYIDLNQYNTGGTVTQWSLGLTECPAFPSTILDPSTGILSVVKAEVLQTQFGCSLINASNASGQDSMELYIGDLIDAT